LLEPGLIIMWKQHLSTAATATLLIVATLLVLLPELRTPPMRVVLNGLAFPFFGLSLWQTYKSGFLTKTPRQIYQSYRMPNPPKRQENSLLKVLAGVMTVPAMFLVQWTLGSA
jgi:hypothetical protein